MVQVYCRLRKTACPVPTACSIAVACTAPPSESPPQRPPLVPIAQEILSDLSTILGQRGTAYADIADNSEVFAKLMQAVGIVLPPGMTPTQFHCLSNICTKLARFATGDRQHEDTYLDIANYAVLVAAHQRREKK